jgi:fumarylacetoacetase
MAVKSWIASANDPESDFPIENLPYGVVCTEEGNHIGVAIGDRILDLQACAKRELLDGLSEPILNACCAPTLNPLMALEAASWTLLRRRITALFDAEQADSPTQARVAPLLISMRDAAMQLPAAIGDYTDFYASIHHATRVGRLFRPANPLLPNYKYIPIGYHGRASSIVISGTEIRRPCGQIKQADGEPIFSSTQSLDYELEVGMYVGPGNQLGNPIPAAEAEDHIFGFCLVNDWSARDIQSWEYQPLGPFLAKSFATTVSPWVVPLQALAPYRVTAEARAEGDPAPLPYLQLPSTRSGAFNLTLEVSLQSSRMRESGAEPFVVTRSNMRHLYWTPAQLVTHHTSNGCNLFPGDLLATGTISGPDEGSEGCLLEMQLRDEPALLPNGEVRKFLQDGDQVTLRAYCEVPGLPRIGFGVCTGTVTAAACNP